VNRLKVFTFTTLGISIPTSIGMLAGAVVASALNNKPEWNTAYEDGIGFLIQDMLYPRGFAKFLLVLLVLSGINVNILSLYSAAISCQQVARPFARIPRFIWQLACFGVVLLLALLGRRKLNTYLVNFLSLLGYWCTSFVIIVLTEHTFIRKRHFANYNLAAWNDPAGLPHGIAASIAFSLGVLAWVMGMAQTWYVGPLAKLIGTYGGDVANEFTFVVTALTYYPLRLVEMRVFGK
jgi:purine-cytosine permease-like protein